MLLKELMSPAELILFSEGLTGFSSSVLKPIFSSSYVSLRLGCRAVMISPPSFSTIAEFTPALVFGMAKLALFVDHLALRLDFSRAAGFDSPATPASRGASSFFGGSGKALLPCMAVLEVGGS